MSDLTLIHGGAAERQQLVRDRLLIEAAARARAPGDLAGFAVITWAADGTPVVSSWFLPGTFPLAGIGVGGLIAATGTRIQVDEVLGLQATQKG